MHIIQPQMYPVASSMHSCLLKHYSHITSWFKKKVLVVINISTKMDYYPMLLLQSRTWSQVQLQLAVMICNMTFDDLKITYKRLESIVDGANRRSAIDFDDPDRFTDKQYFILMGITKENYKNLYASIPSTGLQKTELRSANQAIGCLPVKWRLWLSKFSSCHIILMSRWENC